MATPPLTGSAASILLNRGARAFKVMPHQGQPGHRSQVVIELLDDEWAQAHGEVSGRSNRNSPDNAPGGSGDDDAIALDCEFTRKVNACHSWAHGFR